MNKFVHGFFLTSKSSSMGGYASIPLDIKNRDETYTVNPSISPVDYFNHCTNNVQSASSTKLVYVPPDLTAKVTLYQTVDLSFNHIQDIPPSLPLTLPHLTKLNVSHNKLIGLPDSIFGFIHLKELDVSFNQISGLPDSLVTLVNLKKLDLSNNLISSLPSSVDGLTSLEKIDLSHNKLEHLPISLGNIKSLRVLLANKNEFSLEFRQLVEAGNCDLLKHLKNCYQESQKGDVYVPTNLFRRDRGSVFDSKILNSGSAQSFFTQIQTQAVNTGNRILTPMIPPPGSTLLDTESIKDCLLGLFYGSAIGDSLGIFTQSLTSTQAEFYYERDNFVDGQLHVDEFRCHYNKGDVTLASSLVFIVLESLIAWGGVVDELDYVKKLDQLIKTTDKPLTSPVLQGVSAKANFVVDPQAAAKEWTEQKDSTAQTLVCDSYCLSPMIGLVVSQFHDLREIERNAARICRSTHIDQGNVDAATLLATCLAKLIQGKSIDEAMEEIVASVSTLCGKEDDHGTERNNNIIEKSHPLTTLKNLQDALGVYRDHGFEEAMLFTIMKGGDACVAGQIVGAVLGLTCRFSNLPSHLINILDQNFRRMMDKKLNNLFDVMGIP